MKRTIVKVQLSIASSDGIRRVMVYDKNNKYIHEGVAPRGIDKWMQGEFKRFFYADIDLKTKDFVLLKEAPWQDW